MNRTVNLVARSLGFTWVGVLAFGLYPPAGRAAVFQAVAYGMAGLGLLAWALLDHAPRAAGYRARGLPVALAVIAAATGAGAASGVDGGTAMIIIALVAAMAAGGDLDPGPAVAVTAAGILATEVSGLAFGASAATLIGFPVVIASGLIIGRNRGAFRIAAEQSAALLAQRERLEAEQRRADLLDERARLAREIHDVLAHSLGALGIQIQAARSVLTDYGDVDRAVELLTAAQRMAAEGLTETRRAVHALRSDTLPLADELAKATSGHAERYHVAVSLDTEGEPRPVPADATVALLRVAQEALVNAAKHGAGKPVTVRLDYQAAGVRLTVRNELDDTDAGNAASDAAAQDGATPDGPVPDGPVPAGPVPAGPVPDGTVPRAARLSTLNAGYGLTGMRERLRMLNGTLEAGRDGACWVVTAQVPGSALGGETDKMTS